MPVPEPTAGVRYRLRQVFRYDYDGPAAFLLHRLVVVPPLWHGDQRLRAGVVEVSDPTAQVDWQADGHGNRVCSIRIAAVPRRLELAVGVVVERAGRPQEEPADRLTDPRLLGPSLLTGADRRIRRLAGQERTGDVLSRADRICARVHELIGYRIGATTVHTTAVQALAGGAGVCQDQAHLMIAICRAAGIPCRYVSGHLVGQGGTHAWVEVLVADGRQARAVAFDPCHARRADARYVTVAVGRDYIDVPPTSGWYSGAARGELTAERTLRSEPLAA